MEDFSLLTSIATALGLAVAGGILARLAGISPIAGYLAAGLVISPLTPGYDADAEAIEELAGLGVIFLMFGVGLHFNLSDLFEYFSPQEHRQVYSELVAQARPGARLVYWNLLASRGAVPGLPVTRLQAEARALHRQDRAWFYQALQVDRRD